MAPLEAVFLLAPGGDQSSVAAALRDRWPIRTGTTVADVRAHLDEDVAVVVLDSAVESVALEDITTMIDERTPQAQLLHLTTGQPEPRALADATLEPGVEPAQIRSTVERLQARARYDRLLSAFCVATRCRDEGADGESKSDRELADLEAELDELVGSLSDEDAFDVALSR